MLYHKHGKGNRNRIQYAILGAVGEAGILVRDRVAEGVLQLFRTLPGKPRKTNPRYDIPRGVRRLVALGYLRVSKKNNEEVLIITAKGKHVLAQITRGNIPLKKPKRWDGKWRVVIYDIGEERRRLRYAFRKTLIDFGFLLIQKSVWVYPYPCEGLLAMCKGDLKMGKEVLYLVVDKLENDHWLKQHFEV